MSIILDSNAYGNLSARRQTPTRTERHWPISDMNRATEAGRPPRGYVAAPPASRVLPCRWRDRPTGSP
jgi:hypothetical protein